MMDLQSLIDTTQKSVFFLLTFADDAIVLLFSRLGIHLPWLQWLSTLLLMLTLATWTWRLLYRYQHRLQRTAQSSHNR